jgi:hypothetical protein
VVSPNQDPYKLPTLKHWCIIYRIHGLKYKLLHEFLNYITVHRSWSVQSLKYRGSDTKDWHSMVQGPASSPKMQNPRQLFRAQASNWLLSPQVGCHWATQTCHSTHNTQSSLQPKRSTSKAWVTKAQQDWPDSMAINSRLLVCKASWESSILCQTHAKSESLFSSFSRIQIISKKSTSYSTQTSVANNQVYYATHNHHR